MHSHPFILCLMLSALLLLCRSSFAGPSEHSQNRQTITVVSDDNYPPYIFRDVKGNLQGILIDEWSLWEKKTGIKVDFRGMDWGTAQKFMAGGNADVIDTMFFTDERAQRYDFSKPYATLEVPIFFHKNISGITDISSLHGFVVGVKDGDACVDVLQRNGISTLKTYHNYERIVQAAANRAISVFCMDEPPALYYLYKLNIEKEYRHSRPLYAGQFHRAVKKGRTDLLGVIEGGFSKITGKEHEEIEKKWMGTTLHTDPVYVRNIAYSLAGIGAIALLLVLWNLLLRKRVASRTAELLKTLAELRKKEEGLILSEKKFSTLFRYSPDGIIISTLKDGTYLEVNDAYLRMSGYSREELIGRSALDIGICADPGERMKMVAALREQGKFVNQETRFRTRSGKVLDVLRTAEMIDYGDEPCMISSSRDISELKSTERELKRSEAMIRKSQERYRSIFNSTLDGVYEVNAEGVFTQMNTAGARIFGYSAPEEIIGLNAVEFWRDTRDREAFRAELKLKKSVSAYYMPSKKKDGEPIELESSSRIIEDREGNLLGIEGILRDVTERKLVEAALQESEERFRSVMDNIAVGVSVISPDMKILSLNATMKKWFPHIEVSQNPFCYKAFNDPPGKDICSYCPTVKTLKDGKRHESVTTTPAGDGFMSYRVISSPLFDKDGGIIAAIEMVDDITERVLAEKELQRYSSELERSNKALQDALADVRTLGGMLPICSSCKKIRDDKGYWSQIESYISEHSGAAFSHGICPECEKKVYEELDKLIKDQE